MAVPLYMDVHVPAAITHQLRERGVDVVTAQEDEAATLSDEELLKRCSGLGRVIFTQDIRFKALAEEWQRQGTTFCGLAFGHPLRAPLGRYVRDLEIIAKATDPADWRGSVMHLPL
jgi:hypothetical protein